MGHGVDILNPATANSIWPRLRSAGFKRAPGRRFTKAAGDGVTQRIGLQLLRSGLDLDVYFGIGFEALKPFETAWRGFGSDSQLGDAIGHLSPPFRWRGLLVLNQEQLAHDCLFELDNHVLPFLDKYSDLREAVECWDGDYPCGRTNARIFGALGRLALGDRAGAAASANLHRERLEALGADDDVLEEQRELARFVAVYRRDR